VAKPFKARLALDPKKEVKVPPSCGVHFKCIWCGDNLGFTFAAKVPIGDIICPACGARQYRVDYTFERLV